MAQMLPGFNVIGPINNLSVYKMRGTHKVVVRMKGGAKKEKISRLPSFEPTRRINKEFGGRSTAAKYIRTAMGPQTTLADHNIAGTLNALLRPIQLLDTESETGQRSICLSKQLQLLEGFNLNRYTTFDTIVRSPVTHTLSRDRLTAAVTVPALIPGINFHVPGVKAFYSFIVALGVVPDLFFDGNTYSADSAFTKVHPVVAESIWYPVRSGSPALSLEASLLDQPFTAAVSLVLTVGIRYGMVGDGGVIQQVQHAGAAKVVAVG